jgi:hypothetical protein
MRNLIALCLLLTFSRAAAAEPDRCTPEWAAQVTSSTAAAGGQRAADEAVERIAACSNGRTLLEGLAKGAKVSQRTPQQTPAASTPSPEVPNAPTTATPAVQPVSFWPHGLFVGPGVDPKPLVALSPQAMLTPIVYAAVLRGLKNKLLSDIRDLQQRCRGFARCPLKDLRDWLGTFSEYAALVSRPGVTLETLREAGDLIASIAAESPEMRMAEAIGRAIGRMTKEQKEEFKATHQKLADAVDAPDGPERLRMLLEHPEDLASAYPVAMVGASRMASAGRAVIVEFDGTGLDGSCSPQLRQSTMAALQKRKHPGAKLYVVGNAGDPPRDVLIVGDVVDRSSSHGNCAAGQGGFCVRLTVNKEYLRSNAPVGGEAIYSAPFVCPAPSESALDGVSRRAWDLFSVELEAPQVAISQVHPIQPRCLEIKSTTPSDFTEGLVRDPGKWKQTLRLPTTDTSWPGFGQEVAETLLPHSKIIGALNGSPQPGGRDFSLTWKTKDDSRGGIPKEVFFTLDWNRVEGNLSANLKLTPKNHKDCSFTALSFQQTAASAISVWLMNLQFGDAPGHDEKPKEPTRPPKPPEVAPKADPNNWPYSPLGIVFAGLPQLVDKDPRNDGRGAAFAGVDAVLLTTTVVMVAMSVSARNDFASSRKDDDLNRANHLLTVAKLAGGAALANRLLSVAW